MLRMASCGHNHVWLSLAVQVVKRDGTIVQFDSKHIQNAILGAMKELGKPDVDAAARITGEVVKILTERGSEKHHVEEIQDLVELSLMRHGFYDVAKAYISCRKQRENERMEKKALLGVKPTRWTKKALSTNAVRLLVSRYLLRDSQGRVVETPEGIVYRVASAVAAAEARFDSRLVPLPANFTANQYVLESIRKILEQAGRPQDFVESSVPEPVANYFHLFSDMIFEKRFLPNSPTLFNAGARLGQLTKKLQNTPLQLQTNGRIPSYSSTPLKNA